MEYKRLIFGCAEPAEKLMHKLLNVALVAIEPVVDPLHGGLQLHKHAKKAAPFFEVSYLGREVVLRPATDAPEY